MKVVAVMRRGTNTEQATFFAVKYNNFVCGYTDDLLIFRKYVKLFEKRTKILIFKLHYYRDTELWPHLYE